MGSCGVPIEEQTLNFGGRVLDSSELLGEIGLGEESTVFLNLDLEGGGKKRKKKTYTKPKKVKSKRKKVKLAVLKFYKVDSNDKILSTVSTSLIYCPPRRHISHPPH